MKQKDGDKSPKIDRHVDCTKKDECACEGENG